MEDLFIDFVELLVEIINGSETKNEENDFREIALFKTGVVL